MEYKGKTALVTGASSGIGKAFAQALAARGSHVIVTARSQDKLEALAETLASTYGVQVYVLPRDLSKPGEARALAEEVKKRGLSVEILINNAGFGTFGRFDEIDSDREQEMVTLNIASVVELTHQFLPDMVSKQDGVIVNVASLASFVSGAYMAVYSASKAFMLSFSEALWAENRRRGVRVVALCPGTTQTEFFNVIGTMGAAGKTPITTPERVVQTGLRGIEKGRNYIVDGAGNYIASLIFRLLPRKVTAKLLEKIGRPSLPQRAGSEQSFS